MFIEKWSLYVQEKGKYILTHYAKIGSCIHLYKTGDYSTSTQVNMHLHTHTFMCTQIVRYKAS